MTRLTNTANLVQRRATFVAALALASTVPTSGAFAQAVPSPGPAGHCLGSSRIVRGLGGAVLGAGLGFFTAKVRMSDWNDASRTSAASRQRMEATIGGAAIGALIGALVPYHGECSANRTLVSGQDAARPSRPAITADEINRAGVSGSVYDVIYALRRPWLNDRGVNDMSEAPHVVTTADGQEITVPGEPRLIVYLDNMRLGTIGELKTLPTTGVLAIRYYDPSQATLKWGVGHTHGAIQVVTVLDDATQP
jgi:hypothetical protein